jgi:hypothetical protein
METIDKFLQIYCKILNEGNQIPGYTILYCVFVRTFVITFYYGSGTVINYGSGSNFLTSYGSGSTRQKITVPTVPVAQQCLDGAARRRDVRLDGGGVVAASELLLLRLATPDDGDGEQLLVHTPVQVKDLQHLYPSKPEYNNVRP